MYNNWGVYKDYKLLWSEKQARMNTVAELAKYVLYVLGMAIIHSDS